jgi:hypothetical protein
MSRDQSRGHRIAQRHVSENALPARRGVGAGMTDSFAQEGAPAADAGKTSKRVLVISRRGPPPRPFGWEIRDANGEIGRWEST